MPRRPVTPRRTTSRSDDGESLEAARERKERALADLRELEVLRRRGALVPVELAEEGWRTALASLRATLEALPDRLAAAGVVDAAGAEAVRDAIRDALAAAAQTDPRRWAQAYAAQDASARVTVDALLAAE